jgi:hypothetical protein
MAEVAAASNDTALMAVIALFAIMVGIGIATAFYVARCDEFRRECAERVARANAEVLAVRKMRREGEIREKIYGDIPIERILGGQNDG